MTWMAILMLAACSRAVNNPQSVIIDGLSSSDPQVLEMLQGLIDVARNDPSDGGHRGRLGLAYAANGYEEAALACYVQAESLAPDSFEWPYLQSLILAERGFPEQALSKLARTLELDPSHISAWLWQGNWLLDQNRIDGAANAFEKARQLGSGAPAVVGQARVHIRRGEPELARALLEPLSRRLEHPYVFRLLSTALRDLGQIEAARAALDRGVHARQFKWLDEVLDRKTQFIAGFGRRLLTAESLLAGGKPGEALTILENLAVQYPDHGAMLNLLAVAYSRTEQPAESMATLEKALAAAPEYYPIHLNLAGAYDTKGEFSAALDYLDQAIQIHPSSGVAHQQKGIVLMRMQRYEEAIHAFDMAARYGVRDPEMFYFAGVMESSSGHFVEAVRYFRQATRVDKSYTNAYLHEARSLGELRRFDEARESLRHAEELGDQVKDVRITGAWLDQLEASGT